MISMVIQLGLRLSSVLLKLEHLIYSFIKELRYQLSSFVMEQNL